MAKSTPRIVKIRPDHYERLRENTHILYRCFNRRKSLLYVGMTNNPETRFKHHCANKVWWKYVDHITLQEFSNRSELARAEANAIKQEFPRFNVVEPSGGYPNRGRARGLWPDASTFGVVTPDYGFLIDMTLEQQLYPCVECNARAIYCEGDSVSCGLCSSKWSFDDWFEMTFVRGNTPDVGNQLTLM